MRKQEESQYDRSGKVIYENVKHFFEVQNVLKNKKPCELDLLQRVNHILPSPPSSISAATLSTHEAKEAATENMGKDVIHTPSSTTPFSQSLFAIAVVQLFLLRVGQYFICKANLFKLKSEGDREKIVVCSRCNIQSYISTGATIDKCQMPN